MTYFLAVSSVPIWIGGIASGVGALGTFAAVALALHSAAADRKRLRQKVHIRAMQAGSEVTVTVTNDGPRDVQIDMVKLYGETMTHFRTPTRAEPFPDAIGVARSSRLEFRDVFDDLMDVEVFTAVGNFSAEKKDVVRMGE